MGILNLCHGSVVKAWTSGSKLRRGRESVPKSYTTSREWEKGWGLEEGQGKRHKKEERWFRTLRLPSLFTLPQNSVLPSLTGTDANSQLSPNPSTISSLILVLIISLSYTGIAVWPTILQFYERIQNYLLLTGFRKWLRGGGDVDGIGNDPDESR